ncbi:unnamed protein product [Alopecurus aequalis]
MGKRSSHRGGDDSRGQSASRRTSGEQGGKKEQDSISLLVRNIPHDCSSDLLVAFQKFGRIRDFYIPKDYHSGEPRGFAFVEFCDSRDASEAQRRMNHKMLCGREINVVYATAKRRRPDIMRRKTGDGSHSDYKGRHVSRHGRSRSRSHSRSPRRGGCDRSRSLSPAARRRGDYSASPKRKEECQTKSSGQSKERDKGKKQEPCTPRDRSDRHDADNGSNGRRATPDYSAAPKRTEEYQAKSPRQAKKHDEDKRQRSCTPAARNDCREAHNGHNERPARTDGEGSCPRQMSPRPSSGSHSRRRDDYSNSPKGKEEHQEQSPRHSKEYIKCKKQRSDTPDNRNDRRDADHSHNEIQDDHPTSPKIQEERQEKSSLESKEYDKDTNRRSYAPHDRNDRLDADNGSKDSNVHVDRKLVTPDGEGSHADRRSPEPATRSSSRRQDDYAASAKRKEELRGKSPKQSNEHEDKKRRSYTPDERNGRYDADNCNKKKQDDYSASPKRKEECWAKSPRQTKEREVQRRSYAPDDRIVHHEADNGYNERCASPDNGSPKRTEEPRQAKSQSHSNKHDNDKNQRSYTRDDRKDHCNADNASKERNDYSASENIKEKERGENFPRQSKEYDENKKGGSFTPDDRNNHHDTDNGSKERRDDNSASRKRIEDHHAKSPRQSKENESDKRGSYTYDDRKDHCDADNGSRERRDDYSASGNRKEERQAKSPRQSKEHDDNKKRGSFTHDDRNDQHDTDNGSKRRDDNSAARRRMEDHRAKSPRQSKEHEKDKKRGSYTYDDRKDRRYADNGSRERRDDYSASRKRMKDHRAKSPRQSKEHENDKKRGSSTHDGRKDRCDADNGSRERRDDYSASRKRMEDHRAKSPRQSKEHENDKKRGSSTHDGRKDRCEADNGSRGRDDYIASRKRKEECQGKSPRQSKEHDQNKKRGSYAADDRNDLHDAGNGCNEKLAAPDGEGSHPYPRGRSPRLSSGR